MHQGDEDQPADGITRTSACSVYDHRCVNIHRLERSQGNSVFDVQRTDTRPSQSGEVRAAPQPRTDIVRQGPYIGALAARRGFAGRHRASESLHSNFVYGHAACRPLDLLSCPCVLVERACHEFDGAVHGWSLGLTRPGTPPGSRRALDSAPDDFTCETISPSASPVLVAIPSRTTASYVLSASSNPRKFGRLTQTDRKEPGRHRIECPGMSGLGCTKHPAHALEGGIGTHSDGLVQQENAVNACAAAAQAGPVSAAPRHPPPGESSDLLHHRSAGTVGSPRSTELVIREVQLRHLPQCQNMGEPGTEKSCGVLKALVRLALPTVSSERRHVDVGVDSDPG